jgi:FkbM family methyltransferase
MTNHPVFEKFLPYSGPVPQGCQIDFIGATTRCEFVQISNPFPSEVQLVYPTVDEEYFEWIDILESVCLARDRFTMLELGAGYGRWAVRAATAARQRGLQCHLVAVEAEPLHFKWLRQHLCDNGLDPARHTLVQGAVTDQPGKTLFYIGMPKGGQDRADQWYGQAITRSYEQVRTKTWKRYQGFRVLKLKSGWKSIEVQAVTLESLLRDLDRVDLIDMDVQGKELKIVRSAIDELDRKVCRLHIATHTPEIQEGLKDTLGSRGWICHFDFSCFSTTATAFGPVSFEDGVQSWTNPRMR